MEKIFYFLLILLIFHVNSILPDDERERLLNKYAKKISIDKDDDFFELNDVNDRLYFQTSYNQNYDFDKMKKLIKDNGFPESYNFFKDTNIKPNIKNQGSCGSCWAIASTSALSYRYMKLGINVDFSPQHELSCYNSLCQGGNNLIDPFLSLVINGTVTEQCFPYSSGSGAVEECRTTCVDPNMEYKKYYAKNAYSIKLEGNDIYDVTKIVIDQLVTNGPVMTSIFLYQDLEKLMNNSNCPNMIYKYDGVSGSLGGHAIVIVGYNFTDDKYYWILQNSWGEEFCDHGLFYMEFGQAGVGSCSFAEPLLEREESTKLIEIKYKNQDKTCDLEIQTDSNLENWKSQLIIVYEHETSGFEFDFICGVTKITKDDDLKIYCNYENENVNAFKGLFKYKTFRTNGKKNNFVLDESFIDKTFMFYGNDKINPITQLDMFGNSFNRKIFISKYSTMLYFLYEPIGNDLFMPKISPSEIFASFISFSRCNRTDIEKFGQYLAYCNLTESETKYLFGDDRIVSQGLCGVSYYRNIIPVVLDETKSPIFIINSIDLIDYKEYVFYVKLHSKIIGNIDGYQRDGNNTFVVVVLAEYNNKNNTYIMNCITGTPKSDKMDSHDLNCIIYYFDDIMPTNIYVTPYYGISALYSPFQIIIEQDIKANNKIKQNFAKNNEILNSNFSNIVKVPFILVLLLFGLLI